MFSTTMFQQLNAQTVYDMIHWLASEYTGKGAVHCDTDYELRAAVRAANGDFSKVNEDGEEYWVQYNTVQEGREKLATEFNWYINFCIESEGIHLKPGATINDVLDLFDKYRITDAKKWVNFYTKQVKDECLKLAKAEKKLNSMKQIQRNRVTLSLKEEKKPQSITEFKWIKHQSILIGKNFSNDDGTKILGLDFDGTIVSTRSGNTFPIDANDWKLMPNVKEKLQKACDDGLKLVIFTNQAGISSGKVSETDFKKKIESVVKELNLPFHVFVSTKKDNYRKPCMGMWTYHQRRLNENIEYKKSLYVGDAAGRPECKATKRKKDFSNSDLLFAKNIGIPFQTPEQYFLGITEPQMKEFNMKEHILLTPICINNRFPKKYRGKDKWGKYRHYCCSGFRKLMFGDGCACCKEPIKNREQVLCAHDKKTKEYISVHNKCIFKKKYRSIYNKLMLDKINLRESIFELTTSNSYIGELGLKDIHTIYERDIVGIGPTDIPMSCYH